MPELDDVVSGETIESAWGNDIRDRTLQRYVNSTERDTLNPSPSAGDLAYITATEIVQFFDGSGWVNMLDHGVLAGLADDDHSQYHTDARALDWLLSVEARASQWVGTGYFPVQAGTVEATAALTIPGDWNSYEVMAWCSWTQNSNAAAGVVISELRIDGELRQELDSWAEAGTSGRWVVVSHVARKTPLTTVGTCLVELWAEPNTADVNFKDMHLMAQARRLT